MKFRSDLISGHTEEEEKINRLFTWHKRVRKSLSHMHTPHDRLSCEQSLEKILHGLTWMPAWYSHTSVTAPCRLVILNGAESLVSVSASGQHSTQTARAWYHPQYRDETTCGGTSKRVVLICWLICCSSLGGFYEYSDCGCMAPSQIGSMESGRSAESRQAGSPSEKCTTMAACELVYRFFVFGRPSVEQHLDMCATRILVLCICSGLIGYLKLDVEVLSCYCSPAQCRLVNGSSTKRQ